MSVDKVLDRSGNEQKVLGVVKGIIERAKEKGGNRCRTREGP
jgi:hypothetical protein